jgi:hypothetical protein
MWRSLVHKCLLESKIEVYILYKRDWSDQETESRNEGGGATSSEAAQEYFGAKWRIAYCYKERWMDPKISCVILFFDIDLIQNHFESNVQSLNFRLQSFSAGKWNFFDPPFRIFSIASWIFSSS